MERWLRQTSSKPVFPELEWEKPERKDQAGKLAIIGGNSHGFAAPLKAFEFANAYGVGEIRVLLPDAAKKTIGPLWPEVFFCASTKSGGFAKDAKEVIMGNLLWADGVLLPGDMGRNSETAIVIEEILRTTTTLVTITKDALDYFLDTPKVLFERNNTLVVASFSQLQRLVSKLPASPIALQFSMPLQVFAEALSHISLDCSTMIITKFASKVVVACKGEASVTDSDDEDSIWRLETAAKATVSLLHHPDKPFQALTASVYSK